MSKRFLSGINVTGTATLNTVANAGLDTDKFLVLDAAGNIDFRTGDELKLDIGANVVSRIEHEVKLGETMTIGTPVYIGVDLNAGTNMTVYKATNATEAGSSKTIGLIASSGITNDLVEVVTEGLLEGLNTSTATKGDPVWLGVNGALLFGLANKPVAPAHMVFLGIVTRVQQNNGEIFVKVQNGFEMNEIHNYLQGNVQNNEVIVYESATSLYKPKSIPTILGYTPVPDSRTLTINGTTYDLSANRAWTITTDASARSILRYVATANQTTFTISGGYTPGLTDVYRNGVKLDNSTDFTATNGTTIVLTNGASVNDVIEVYRYQTAFLANNALRVVTEFIATAGQTTFNVTYNSGLVDVFYNGSKLLSTEYTAGNGTSIILNFPCNVNDTLEVHAYSYQVGAFTGQAQLNGTGLVRMSGTTVTYDNATYATQSYVTTAVANLVNSAPATLDTLNELAAALGNDANFATTITTSISTKQAQLNGTGFVKVSGTTVSYDNSTYLTTSSASSTYLPLSGGTLTGALNGTSATFGGNVNLTGATTTIQLQGTSYGNIAADKALYIDAGGSSAMYLRTNGGANTTTITSTGDLAIGTTPPTTSNFPHLFSGRNFVTFSGSSNDVYIGSNFYYNGGFKARYSEPSIMISSSNGDIILGNSSSGTANGALTVSEKMRITSGGNVGILTSSPQTPLQILKDTNTNGTNIEEANMAFSVLSASGQSKIAIGACNAGNYGYIQVMQDATSWTNRNLTLQPRGGSVGVGTYTPSDKLQVVGSLRWGSATNNLVSFADGGGVYMELSAPNSSTRNLRIQGINNAGNKYSAIRLEAGIEEIAFVTADVERMRISSPGDLYLYNGSIQQQGVWTVFNTGYTDGTSSFNFDIGVGDEGGGGNIFKVEAGFAHYFGMAYNCLAEFYISTRGTGSEITDVIRRDTSLAGSFTAWKTTSTVLRINKSAGTYPGGGRYWIKVTKVNY